MELLSYSIGLILFGFLLESTARETYIKYIGLRKFLLTKERPKLVRETVLIFSRFFSRFSKPSLSFITHRISPLNIAFTLILAGPLYSWASQYFDFYDYVECKSGYAIEVSPGAYVACTDATAYWNAEFDGDRLVYLEMTSASKLNPILERKIK